MVVGLTGPFRVIVESEQEDRYRSPLRVSSPSSSLGSSVSVAHGERISRGHESGSENRNGDISDRQESRFETTGVSSSTSRSAELRRLAQVIFLSFFLFL